MSSLIDKAKKLRIVRAWKRYSEANGNLLAGGVTYNAFFSVIPAIAIGFTVFGIVLRNNPDMLDTIAESLNETLPGMVKTESNPSGAISVSAPSTAALTITGLVSLAVLLNSGLGWVGALRTAIRAIFGLDSSPGNAVMAKLRDLGTLVTLGLGIALSAVLTSAVGGAAKSLAEAVGLGGLTWLVTIIGLAVGFGFDFLLMILLLRVLTGVKLPHEHIRDGALFGAAWLTLIKYFGAMLMEKFKDNPLVASLGVSVALLLWLYLMSRIVLLSAAWAANDVDDLHDPGTLRTGERAEQARAQAGALAAVAAAGHGSSSGVAGGLEISKLGRPSTERASRSDVDAASVEDSKSDEILKAAGSLLGAALVLRLIKRQRENS